MSDPKFEKPNLDLINMVQRGRMQHDADAIPSQIRGAYWLEAKPNTRTDEAIFQPTPRAGQWILPTTLSEVDALWEKIKQATQAAELGYKSKVATASRSGNNTDRVILVRTYDANDLADVERVRSTLSALGIDDALAYEQIVTEDKDVE